MYTQLRKEHHKLISLLDTLDQCVLKGGSIKQFIEHLNEFIKFATEHFKHQEEIMQQHNYTEISHHIKEHAALLARLHSLARTLSKGDTPFNRGYMNLLRIWLEMHLVDSDNMLDEFLSPTKRILSKQESANQDNFVGVYREF